MRVRERQKTILIVDDECDARVFLYELLMGDGCVVGTASDGHEAMAFVKRYRPDLVITDLRMPGVEGLDLITQVKRLSPETHVLILTAYGSFQLYLAAIERGADDLLLKTTKNEELLRVIRRILESPKESHHEHSDRR